MQSISDQEEQFTKKLIWKVPHFNNKKCAFLAAMMANVTLRLCKPHCAMDPEWTSEAIKTQIKRAISQLFETTVTPKADRQSSLPTMDDKAFPAPTFAYCFYLLKEVLKGVFRANIISALLSSQRHSETS